MLMDFSVSPNPTTMAMMIQTAVSICQQSPKNAVLLRYPHRIGTQPEAVWLALVRKIEDRLLAGGMSLGGTLSAIVDTANAHGNDKRDAVLTFRLCISEAFAEDSSWTSCTWLNQHKVIQNVHLLPPRDLRFVPQQDSTQRKEFLNPQERGAQIGHQAAVQILSALVLGRASEEPRKRKVVVADFFPSVGDWMDGCWKMHSSYLQGEEIPMVVYFCRYASNEISEHGGMKGRCQQMLMQEWWQSHQDAGPEQPIAGAEDAVAKPQLAMLSWSTDGSRILFPAIIKQKFPPDSEFYQQWSSGCDAVQTLIDQLEASNLHASGRPVANDQVVSLTGPDLNGNSPCKFDHPISIEGIPLADFDMDQLHLGQS